MIYSFGDVYVDLVGILDKPIAAEGILNATTFKMTPGGVAFNFARYAAYFGERVNLIASIGNDSFGNFLITECEAHNIDLSVIVDANLPTGIMNIIYSPDEKSSRTNRLFIKNVGNANGAITPESLLDLDLRFEENDILYLTGYSIFNEHVNVGAVGALISQARDCGVRIVFDVLPHQLWRVGNWESITELLKEAELAPVDLLIGEFRSLGFLTRMDFEKEPDSGDLIELSSRLTDQTSALLVRYGFENCEYESLLIDSKLIYDKNTGYSKLDSSEKKAFGDRLTVAAIQQLLLGRISWSYSKDDDCSVTLSVLDRLNPYLNKDSRVLDVGCGFGRAISHLKSRGFYHVDGVEPSGSMVDEALKRNPDSKIYHGDLLSVKLEEQYDAVFMIAVMTTMQLDEEIDRYFLRISELLRQNNGVFLLCDFVLNEAVYGDRYRSFGDRFPEAEYGTFMSSKNMICRHFDYSVLKGRIEKYFRVESMQMVELSTNSGKSTNGFVAVLKV